MTTHDEHPEPTGATEAAEIEAAELEVEPAPVSPAPPHAHGASDARGLGRERGHRRRDRDHRGPRRCVRVLLRLTEDQSVALDEAARAAGLTPSGYAAEVVVAASADARPPASEPLRAALGDLIDARAQLRRLGTNVHLAVGALHRNGQPPSWLRAAIEDAARAVARVDQAADAVQRELR